MPITNSHRLGTWTIAALAAAIIIAGAQLFIVDGPASAHQPDGLSLSQTEPPEPPCPYGYDDGCENAPPPPA